MSINVVMILEKLVESIRITLRPSVMAGLIQKGHRVELFFTEAHQ